MPRMAPTREFLMEMAKAGVITLPADENAAPGNGAVRGVDKLELVCEAGPVQGSTFRAAVGRRKLPIGRTKASVSVARRNPFRSVPVPPEPPTDPLPRSPSHPPAAAAAAPPGTPRRGLRWTDERARRLPATDAARPTTSSCSSRTRA